MAVPKESLTLTPDQVEAIGQRLSGLRHDVNNHLTLIMTALELMKRKPDSVPRMLASLSDQPQRIRDEVSRFSTEMEQLLRIDQS